MGARLFALAALLARKQGPKVARLLLLKAQAWLADPANEETKQALRRPAADASPRWRAGRRGA